MQLQEFLTIEGITELVIIDYFYSINQENFTKTADLFAENGELLAPFENPIIGKNALASYLTKEAKGMKLLPNKGIYEPTEDNTKLIKIIGKVKTPLFTVNVAWFFNLNKNREIITAKIKLLASPQELFGLREVINK